MVYAKHKNTRYYKAEVLSVSDNICFLVVFKDESFSNDLPPEDVVVSIILSVKNKIYSVPKQCDCDDR